MKAVHLRTLGKLLALGLMLSGAYFAYQVVNEELTSSRLQARVFAQLARELEFRVAPGPSPSISFPHSGPYDQRLGHSHMTRFVERLTAQDYVITEQARSSPRLLELIDWGLFPAYREKTQAGLQLLDCNGRPLYTVRLPQRVYDSFDAVPPLLVDTLLFIENRHLLDERYPTRNPAVEWGRLTRAALDQAWHWVSPGHETPGGSTLATQIEKYRHSPGGRTASVSEKLRQMVSASLRAYRDGENTLAAQHQIVVDYLNTVPLSARAGYGEINGLGDGLWAWYGRNPEEANQLLRQEGAGRRKAEAYKQVLSLMIAQRRPSAYLREGQEEALGRLTDSYLRLLAAAEVIPPALRDAALPVRLKLRQDAPGKAPVSFVARKDVTAIRTALSGLLEVPRLYDLDRLDLTAAATLNGDTQRAVTQVLQSLKDPAAARARGLYGFHMLREGDDPGKLVFSVTLFERGEEANLLRVQTDNFDQPFDINEGTRLDLGSTAKLRTLVTYLEIIAELHRRYAAMDAQALARVETDPMDALSLWALAHLAGAEDKSLPAMLEAALERRYSASPEEAFFTGGDLHTFENFEPEHNGRVMSVREAFQHSVNLVFIRLMRDVVQHHMFRTPGASALLAGGGAESSRQLYLSRFADMEGREYLQRFYRKYRGKTPEQVEAALLEGVGAAPKRLAAVFRGIEPTAGPDRLRAFMDKHLPAGRLSERELHRLYEAYGPRLSLADRGYVARIHPLEIWLAGFLKHNPAATLSQAVAASRAERQAAYAWLFKSRDRQAQDTRIARMMEIEAFREIHRRWRRLGYPFDSLTASYATAIGASGDRPAALAELVGIILADGVRRPVARIDALHFAAATPYETRLAYRPTPAVRVLPREVADAVRRALLSVVAEGTGRRIKGAFVQRDGSAIEVGGKTGTGDHRFQVYARGGRFVSSRVVSRSATFVFFIGDRFFGTVSTHVRGPDAARYEFTSALSVQLLKALAPTVMPLLEDGAGGGESACRRRLDFAAAHHAAPLPQP